jgi:excisionase family DNA binding protein
MLSITSAAQQFKLPRDTLLNAVRAGTLKAARDRRGVLRIEEQALLGFCAAPAASEEKRPNETLIRLRVMRTDRLPLVLAQQRRLLREAESAT